MGAAAQPGLALLARAQPSLSSRALQANTNTSILRQLEK